MSMIDKVKWAAECKASQGFWQPAFVRLRSFRLYHRLVVVLLATLFAIAIDSPITQAANASFAAKQDFVTSFGPRSVTTVDLNGDGKPDLVSANINSNTVSVLLNTTAPGAATPTFAAKQDFTTGASPMSVAVGDLNGDGKSDLTVANFGSNNVSVLLNTTAPGATTPSFAPKQDFNTSLGPLSVDVSDLNKDGKLDLIVANLNSETVTVLINSAAIGAVTLSFGTNDVATGASPRSVTVADLNGDGNADLAVANIGENTVSVLLNTTAPGAVVASFAPKQDFATGLNPASVAIVDANRDGKLDLTVTNVNADTLSVLLNNTVPGASIPDFAPKQDFATATGPASVAIGDLNGDGKFDLAVVNFSSDKLSVLLNTTAPGSNRLSYADKQDFATGSNPRSVSVSDLNGDGKLDLVAANNSSASVSVFLNTTITGISTASFVPKKDFTSGVNPLAVAAGDLNNDGGQDLVVPNLDADTVSVLLNTSAPGAATAAFASKQDFAVGDGPFSVAVADLNGDGRLDLAVANALEDTVGVLLNTTAPGETTLSFTAQRSFHTGLTPVFLSAADLNGDGKPDLVVVNVNLESVSVLLNTTPSGAATPSFTTEQEFDVNLDPFCLAVSDLNGDGKRDLVVGNLSARNVSVLLNTTAPGADIATFAPKQDFATGIAPGSVAAGDVNGDGKSDLVVVNITSANVSVLLNTTAPGAATPSFAPGKDFDTGTAPRSVSLSDLNGDGKLDLAVANSTDNTVSVFLNTTDTGAATPAFATRENFVTGSDPVFVITSDLNSDGKPDLAAANAASNSVSVLLNTATIVATTTTGLSRQQGSPGSNSQIASVTNDSGTRVGITITSANPSNGVTISNIVNTDGIVTADVVADCSAANATFTLQASDGISTATDTLNVAVTANTAPTLTYANAQSVAFDSSINITPTAASDNGLNTSYAVQSVVPALTTAPIVDVSGVVNIQHAQPAGPHTITIRATDNCGVFTDASFTLTVDPVAINGPMISLSSANYDVNERDGFVTIIVNRTGDLSGSSTTNYSTDDTGSSNVCGALNTGLASSRCDFGLTVGTLTFAANETQQIFQIPIAQDSYNEGLEKFTVSLFKVTGTGTSLALPSSATVTIHDSASAAPNAIDDTETFVRQQYHDFLNREADAPGLAFWKDNIDSCNDATRRPAGLTLQQCIEVKRINTSAAFFLSIEFQETGNLVRSCYVAALDRPFTNNMPALFEFQRDTEAVQRGVIVGQANFEQILNANRDAFLNNFVTRSEFVDLYPTTDTPAQYVDKLFQHSGITPTANERSGAIALFGNATTAADVHARALTLLSVAQNPAFQEREKNRSFVQMQFLGYLRRNPNDEPDSNFDGFNFWVNKLNAAGGNFIDSEMVKAFLVSGEYRQRFGP